MEKRRNLVALTQLPGLPFDEADLRTADLGPLLDSADVVFHQAGQPGVRMSWSTGFADYCEHNVKATQRLLEAARVAGTERVVYASSSSVYGNARRLPHDGDRPALPAQPLRGDQAGGRAPVRAVRRQLGRPDGVPAVLHRLRAAAATGHGHAPPGRGRRRRHALRLFGDGRQVRDFTYVSDVVAANLAAAFSDVPPGTVVNVAGGSNAVMADVIDMIGELAGSPVLLER